MRLPPLAQLAAEAAQDHSQEPLVVLPSDPRATTTPWWHVGRLQTFNPFGALGVVWCTYCRDETDCDTEAHCGQDVYVFRTRCNRCGRLAQWGICHVQVMNPAPLPAVALLWVTTPGQDNR